MGVTRFVGRLLFCSIFVLSAMNKLQTITLADDPVLGYIEPKIAPVRAQLGALLKEKLPDLDIDVNEYLSAWNANVAVISLEVLGSFLFILGSRHGARLLMLALLGITPIMHDFYKLEPGTADWNSEFVNFLKNTAMVGAILVFLSTPDKIARPVSALRPKSKVN